MFQDRFWCIGSNYDVMRVQSVAFSSFFGKSCAPQKKTFFYLYHHKNNKKKKLINITMSHSQRERTQSYCAPISNDTYNSTMISKQEKKINHKIQHLRPSTNCLYPAHICKSNKPYLKPITSVQNFNRWSNLWTTAKNLEKLTWLRESQFNRAMQNRVYQLKVKADF